VDPEAALLASLAKADRKYPADRVRGQMLKYDEYGPADPGDERRGRR
jgi:hypothetical protein